MLVQSSENKGADKLITIRGMKLILCVHVNDISLYILFVICFNQIRILVPKAIYSLLGYSWHGVRSSSLFTMLKALLLQNPLANQSQILCGASLGRGNECLFVAPGSHDQDGRHTDIW